MGGGYGFDFVVVVVWLLCFFVLVCCFSERVLVGRLLFFFLNSVFYFLSGCPLNISAVCF